MSSLIRTHIGGQALSDHARARLNSRLRKIGSQKVIRTRFHHFLDCERDLSTEEQRILESLLNYAPTVKSSEDSTISVRIVPREGTISPWSSKATEIIRACGLAHVRRIERGIEYELSPAKTLSSETIQLLYDRMTESVFNDSRQVAELFALSNPSASYSDDTKEITEFSVYAVPRPLQYIHLANEPLLTLRQANTDYGLALSDADMEYLAQAYERLGRDPTDVELMMFAQVNSEHCRHKIFNARWTIDGETMQHSLFDMIRNTHRVSPVGVLSAYEDNAAVLEAGMRRHLHIDPGTNLWTEHEKDYGIVIKVETHNHPTGISPFPGAATGSGGEIRDETACGRGGHPKAGLCGFAVSNLNFEDWPRPWEDAAQESPPRMATPLEIMIEGPIGAASFNNEFGRPCLSGFFRTLQQDLPTEGERQHFGYHKPIMIAGGVGSIDVAHIEKQDIPKGTPIIVLGGPAMLIGLGGGAASSQHTGAGDEDLDYASVQRSNPEMQRRAQEIVEQCVALGEDNPILSIHDVGAGGLSNAIPELVDNDPGGAILELREIPCADSGMSPREIWCNEAQERYVIALRQEAVETFRALCHRERCPFAVVGHANSEGQLTLTDAQLSDRPVDVPMSLLFGESSNMNMAVSRTTRNLTEVDTTGIDIQDAVERVLTFPAVASKSFLITIGDRSVGGLTVQDQMVGPWQIPVADAAVMAADFQGMAGEAMSMGERPALAMYHPAASARMAVAEALSNLAGVRVRDRTKIRLSANWMAASSDPESLAGLYEAVEAVGMQLCPDLSLAIPVGKDSLSMRASWDKHQVTSPISLIVSAFAPVDDIRRYVTPELQNRPDGSSLVLVCLNTHRRLGGSALAQVYNLTGSDVPDIDEAKALATFFDLMQTFLDEDRIQAYHDRSDGGLLSSLCECAFASHHSIEFQLPTTDQEERLEHLFNEEIGAIVQVDSKSVDEFVQRIEAAGLVCGGVGRSYLSEGMPELRITTQEPSGTPLCWELEALYELWARNSYEIARRRDHEDCARNEFERGIKQFSSPDTGLCWQPGFEPDDSASMQISTGELPVVAILREQGINGQVEMAAAFSQAGFVCRDLHMSDLLEDPTLLQGMTGFAACGGFSYGDVLGAGGGWAKHILHNNKLRDSFEEFFERPDVFALGVCNGCQMLSQLREIIPGTDHWPHFVRNRSEQFESRLCQVEVLESPSILFQDMAGSQMPIVVAHGEGRIDLENTSDNWKDLACLRYIDTSSGAAAETQDYPMNPNGSAGGVTALTNQDGRFTIMMPHPERIFRMTQNHLRAAPASWRDRPESPWLQLFRNAWTYVQ